MKRSLCSILLISLLWLSLIGCSAAAPIARIPSPDGKRELRLDRIEPSRDQDRLLPYYQLSLRRMDGRLEVLTSGFESLCGVDLRWLSGHEAQIRLPVPVEARLLIRQQGADGVKLSYEWHEDLVGLQAKSPDGTRRLVQISNCEHTQWDVYLRRRGEANYNEAMRHGWDDPDLVGGFDQRRELLGIEWLDNRHAQIRVQNRQGQVQVRDQVSGIHIQWKFNGGIDSRETPTP